MPGAIFGDVWPAPGTGGSQGLTGNGDVTRYAMGTHFRPLVGGTVTAVRWFVPTAVFPQNGDFAVGLVRVDDTLGIGGAITWLDWNTGVTAPDGFDQGSWITLPLSSPQHVAANEELYAVVRTDRYGFSQRAFQAARTSIDGNLFCQVDTGPYPNGAFVQGSGVANNPPDWGGTAASANATFYGIDVLFTPDGGEPASPWSLWDGTNEAPLTLDGAWDGSTVQPLSSVELAP